MPIERKIHLRTPSKDEFHALDYEVMDLCFSLQRDFGRFVDEKIYQSELTSRCARLGMESVLSEVPVTVHFRGFSKTFRIDLLLNGGVVYELKTVDAIVNKHHAQVLNYLLLLGLPHGKIVNLRPSSVKSAFVTTTITTEDRYNYRVIKEGWNAADDASVMFQGVVEDLLQDWGAFLSLDLYREAVCHLLGGEAHVIKSVDLSYGGRRLGAQPVHMLNDGIAFRLSSLTRELEQYERQLRKFMHLAQLNKVQWVNFNGHNIEFRTLCRR